MPRRPRDVEEGIHHVWVGATGNAAYFEDDLDRLTWIRFLVRLLAIRRSRCVAFCQMTTHVHLLLEASKDCLPLFMRDLNREYAKAFNARHGRAGVLDRSRYGSRRVRSDEDLLGVYGYVALNPVRSGTCGYADEWPWSSHATTVGLSDAFPFVDASLVVRLAGGRGALRHLVATRAAETPVPDGHGRYQVPAVS